MNTSVRNNTRQNGSTRRKPSANSSKMLVAKRKSLRKQHSISLHIPIGDLDSTDSRMNCYTDLPRQVFTLTYLECNETQNPESLEPLENLRKSKWETYLVGLIYNFNYQPSQITGLSEALRRSLRTQFSSSCRQVVYDCQVSVVDNMNPTENDNQALMIHIVENSESRDTQLYRGFLLSWCNPVKQGNLMMPVLLCQGYKRYRAVIHAVLSEWLDVAITRLTLTQEDFLHLTTYCIIMLGEQDNYMATFSYNIPQAGMIKIKVSVENLLKLWKKVHDEDNNEVDLDEVLLFHEALDNFYESTYGIKMGCTHFQNVSVSGAFSLHINAQISSSSTRILHIVLKYLNHLAVERLKVKALNCLGGGQTQELPAISTSQ